MFIIIWQYFTPDNSLQGTTTSIISRPLSINYLYAYNTNLSSLSTFTKLNRDNLNSTSTSILGNMNSLSTFTKLNRDNLNSTCTSVFNKTNFSNLYINWVPTFFQL
jgi:hypothetical protein